MTYSRCNSISRLDFPDATDSLFIVNALLAAVIKNPVARSAESATTISALKQSILECEGSENCSEILFFTCSDKFYFSLSQLTELKRVSDAILREKSYIDRALRLSSIDSGGYQAIISRYAEILSAMELNNADTALDVLSKLMQLLKAYVVVAKERRPDFFEFEYSHSIFRKNNYI